MHRILALLLLLPLWAVGQPTPDISNGRREAIIQRYEMLPQSNATWRERVQSLRPYIGTLLVPRPSNLTEMLLAQVSGDRNAAAKLEKTQTWWIDSGGTYIALRNVVGKPISSLVVEISEGICTAKGESLYFTLKPEDGKPILQSEFVVLSFKLPDRFASGRRCLDIYSANDWENNSAQQGGASKVNGQGDSSIAERDRLAAEVGAERKKRQELEERLAAAQAQGSGRPEAPAVAVGAMRSAHALVIGNAAYSGSARLDNPINDSTAVAQKLRTMGFTVTEVRDATRQRLVQAMGHFRKTASDADLSLLFFSGHGVQIYGTNYILPIDVDQNDVAQATLQGISLNSVVENFLPGKTKIIFLDACRDNPLMRTGDRSVSRGLAPTSVAQGTLIAYATKDGQTAADGTGQKNSPFTKALLEHLSDPSDIAVVLRRVREKVMLTTGGKQQPWEYGSLTGGELVLSAVRR